MKALIYESPAASKIANTVLTICKYQYCFLSAECSLTYKNNTPWRQLLF
jgi:hypothetical protein